MQTGRLLVIVDDVRISRFVGNVAERLGLSCRSINTNSDLVAACKQFDPEVILLAPEMRVTQAKNVLYKLAPQHVHAAIFIAGNNSKRMRELHGIGASLGLNLRGALPDVFDAETLKRELISVFQSLGNCSADPWQSEEKC